MGAVGAVGAVGVARGLLVPPALVVLVVLVVLVILARSAGSLRGVILRRSAAPVVGAAAVGRRAAAAAAALAAGPAAGLAVVVVLGGRGGGRADESAREASEGEKKTKNSHRQRDWMDGFRGEMKSLRRRGCWRVAISPSRGWIRGAVTGIHVSPLVLRWGRRRGSVGVAAKSPAGARCRGDRAPPRLRAGGRPSAVGKGRVAAVARALTLRSTLDRWFRILPSTGSFWMKRHLPAPYFFTPLRSASSSSGDHCVRRVDGNWACQRSEISGDAAERLGHRGLCADERGGQSRRGRVPWSWGRP